MLKSFGFLFTIAVIFGCSSANLAIPTIENGESEDRKSNSLPVFQENNSETIIIVVVPFGYYRGHENINQNPLRQFERDVMRNLQHNFKKKSLKFYTETQAKSENIKADQFMRLSIDQYTPGTPEERVTTQEVYKQIESNAGGRITTTTVKATVITTERTITTAGEVDVVITDTSGKNLFTDHFVTENIIKTQFSTYKGDSRAVDGGFLGMKKDPGTVSQLEPLLKRVGLDLDYKLRQYFNQL